MHFMEKVENKREIRRIASKLDLLGGSIARVTKSEIPIKELVGKINMMGGKVPVQVFDPKAVISEDHLRAAYLNAMIAFDEGSNISRTMKMEMLLFASMQKKIDVAVERIGAKSEKEFVIFCGSGSVYDRVKLLISEPRAVRFSKDHSMAAAKLLGLEDIKIDGILEGMAASRISD